jgi:tight adherence protein B
MHFLIGVGIFIFVVILIEEGIFFLRVLRSPEKKEIRKRLHALTFLEYDNIDIVRKRILSEVPWFHQNLLKWKGIDKLVLLLEQAGTGYTPGFFILVSALLAVTGFSIGLWLRIHFFIPFLGGTGLGCLPLLHILSKRRKRTEKFQRQLPEALDLVARALRAGHAFSGAMKMVADEMDDPIGTEFARTLNEINFGVGVPEALKNLAARASCLDLKFFVVAVVIQRETGGNLAEILENIARVIRERFKLYGRIKVLAAEGRLSAIILTALPFFVALVLLLANPEYLQILARDSIGRVLAGVGLALMGIGVVSMKKLIAIKV